MKILILYASYGNGHFSAANSLKEYIDTFSSENEAILVDSIKYINKFVDKITVDTFAWMSKKVPKLWETTYEKSEKGPLSKINISTMKLMSIKLLELIEEINPDIIISTHPFNNEMCGRLKEKKKISCKIYSVITDFAPHAQYLTRKNVLDCYFVSNYGMKQDLIDYGIETERIKVTGIPISPDFSKIHDKDNIRQELNLNNKFTFLMFASWSEDIYKSIRVFETLLNSKDDIQVIAITGKSKDLKHSFENLVKKYGKENSFKILGFSKKIPELMAISNIVISKPGGLTSSESLACELPIIISSAILGQEEQNSNFLLNNGVAMRIFEETNIHSMFFELLNSPIRYNQMKDMTKIVGKPNASKDIINTILEQ